MLYIQRLYINNFPNVSSYFVTMRSEQTNHVEICGDIIFIKGMETRLNILRKTFLSMYYLLKVLKLNYDYIIRTNISTISNIPKILKYCEILPKDHIYISGCVIDLQWLDYNSGIVDKSLFGTKYASGTNIILSNDVALFMINNFNNFRNEIIDDVAIGLFVSNYLPLAYNNLCKFNPSQLITSHMDISEINNISNEYCFYRNVHAFDRNIDLLIMKHIYDIIYRNYSKNNLKL